MVHWKIRKLGREGYRVTGYLLVNLSYNYIYDLEIISPSSVMIASILDDSCLGEFSHLETQPEP